MIRRLLMTSSVVTRSKLGWLFACLTVSILVHGEPPAKHPLYIGIEGCSSCHADVALGDQFSHWRLGGHARAHASLALPESWQIAQLSGIPEEPQEARMCLSCHSTGAETEDWERLDTFHLEDGLQCEACHGPGSEYATREVMMDRERAMALGLKMPDRNESCRICHRVKGSHEAVLHQPPFDLERAWARIAHPIPARTSDSASDPQPGQVPFQYTGVMACAECHAGAGKNYQFSRWRLSAHARAYATLGTSRGKALAQEAGVIGNPQASPLCLQCHATAYAAQQEALLKGFSKRDGVQCEACHGPGSEYSPEAVMLDAVASRNAGLQEVNEQTCLRCHANAHGKPFDYATALQAIAHPSRAPVLAGTADQPRYLTPLGLALSRDGAELWVTCESAHTIAVVDVRERRLSCEIPVGRQPNELTFDRAGLRAFVSNRLDDSVSVVDTRERRVIATLDVGDEPHGVLVDAADRYLYVLNTSLDNVSVFDLATLQEEKRLTASRSPWSLALSPDGSQIFVTHALSRFIEPLQPSLSEIVVIDTDRAVVEDRFLAPQANLLQGVDWHPSGEFAVITLLRTKNLVPMTRVARGWTISNGLGLIWRDGTVDQVILDQPHLGFADPAAVAVTPDGRHALVTSSGTDRVAVVDLDRLVTLIQTATPHERKSVLPNHMGKSAEFVSHHIPTGASPRGIVCSADGAWAYVANALDDSITVIDLERLEAIDTIDLGGSKEITRARYGERLFHSANITFRRMFSCHTCHPDGHIDNIVYDIEPDGIGISPVDNRTLRGIHDTAPFKWEGTNPSLSRQCGPRLSVFFTRIQPFTPDELAAVDFYICTIPRPPNRYRALGQPLTDAQRRGKELFERTHANDGHEIPVANRCITCHPPPLYTDGLVHDVGTRQWNDRTGTFDVPHLNNIYDSAPYLHNGMAHTLEEIWTRFNPYDQHGVANDMTKDQLNDLVEYLKTL
jgi:YVTN family beta-propeller protein